MFTNLMSKLFGYYNLKKNYLLHYDYSNTTDLMILYFRANCQWIRTISQSR